MYSGFLHCVCCYYRIYSRRRCRRHRNRRSIHHNKLSSQYEIGYIDAASIDLTRSQAICQFNEDQFSNDDDATDDIWNDIENQIPILVVVLIIIGYIYLGAFMCYKLEDWTMIKSVYFCYIALSTIGFGDYVREKNSFKDLMFIYRVAYK